jgi:hypothetical protein
MPVAAGVVSDTRVRTLLAALDMSAASRRAAALDGRHDLQLAEAHMAGVGAAPCRPVGAEDIRDLERRTRHGGRALRGRLHVGEQKIERAGDVADGLDGHARIERRGVKLLMTH